MTVGELKEMLKDVPDNYTVGRTVRHTVNENWYGTRVTTSFYKSNIELSADISNKTLSLVIS